MRKIIATVAVALVCGSMFAQGTWTLDKAHTKIGFNVTHMVVAEVEGSFREFDGSIVSKSEDFSGSEISFTAKTASIDTDNDRRNEHLRSPDFFDVEKFPEITFKGVLAKEGGKYKLKGDLTMHGVTKKVDFDVTHGGVIETGRGQKAGFKISGKVNRHDYGLNWDNKVPSGELVVADEVEIVCKIEANKAS
jgi:polyisoprenoid-binding protein YceI